LNNGGLSTSSTENGVYELNGMTTGVPWTSTPNSTRNTAAKFFIPTYEEIYKSGWYDPNKDGVGGYWDGPTGRAEYPGRPAEAAMINVWSQHPDSNGNMTTDVGAFPFSSAYGTYDQGGNVWEITEYVNGGNDIWVKGGSAWDTELAASKYYQGHNPSQEESGALGFRVAGVPEPSALSLLAIGLGGLAMIRRRRKSRAVDTFVWSILLLVALSFPVRATVSLTDGLVGYYKFEGNFNDSSAVSNNLVPSTNASLTNDRFGNSNAAMSSTSSSYAYTSSNIGVSGFSSRTVSIWAKGGFDDSAFGYFHFGGGWNPLRADGAGGNFAISYVPWKLTNPQRHWPGSISGNIYVDGNYWAYLVTTDPTTLGGLWHQLVYTFDSSNMLSSVYLNGVLQTNNAYADSVDRMNTIPSPLYFSSEGATANITIDDVRVYNRALSANEVQTLYATESVPEPSAVSLLAVGLGVLFRRSRKRV
jgi:hypothetical protein